MLLYNHSTKTRLRKDSTQTFFAYLKTKMLFNIITFGCKVNQYESEVISELMQKSGYTPCDTSDKADIVIINSCTVTSVSDGKVMKCLRRIRRINPSSVILLTGCMPQAMPEETDKFQDADIVIGNASRSEIVSVIGEFLADHQRIIRIKPHNHKTFEPMTVSDFQEHTRAFVKIEDGCNRFCSYCIIPYARGRVRSKSLDDIKTEINKLAAKGYKEVVLVGINLSAYGSDIGADLCDAVEAVCGVDGIERVRLGSLEPERMDKYVIGRLSRLEKFCPQFHLSLQSGCDATLKRMNRHYTADEYRRIVADLRESFDNAAITTDIMVGFAGETDDEFNESLNFAKEIGFAKAHIFPYSRRKGTVADKLDGQIKNEVKEMRSKLMIKATEETRHSFLKAQAGLTEKVLFETYTDGTNNGYTENYTPVKVVSNENYSGKILPVKLTYGGGDFCTGVVTDTL